MARQPQQKRARPRESLGGLESVLGTLDAECRRRAQVQVSAAGLRQPYGRSGSDATRHYGKNEHDSEPVHTGFKLRQLAFDDSGIVALLFGNEMNLNLKRLSLASARLEILIRTDTDLKAQFLELIELRERLQKATRARKPAPVVIVAAA
jgi:hypothetical protein